MVRANEPFDINGGMEKYIRCIEHFQLLDNDTKEPWTDPQMVRMGQIAIGRTGFFKLEYKDCIKKPAVEKLVRTSALIEWTRTKRTTT